MIYPNQLRGEIPERVARKHRHLRRIADAAQALIDSYEVELVTRGTVMLIVPQDALDTLLGALDTEVTDG